MAIIASTLSRIKSDPLHCLGGKQRVNEHFAQAGHVWRDRVLDPATTLMLFLLQVLHGNTAITHLRHLSRVAVSASSYCAARSRLPLKVLATLVESLCCDGINTIQSAAAGPAAWLGRRVVLADATTAATPDTEQFQRRWPQPSAQKPGCGFPIVKLLGALDLATGMILHLTLMSLGCHEMSQLAGLHGALQAGDVLLADRGFCSFAHIALLSYLPVDAVFRAHQKQIVDFTPSRPHRGKRRKGDRRRGVPTSRFVAALGQEDQIVEWVKPQAAPGWVEAIRYAALPTTVRVRELRYHITTRGRRTRVVTIATTLLDPMRYPKRRIAELYGLRWEVETNFRHLKTTMGMEKLKCKSVDGVLKELMIFVLVYNLVRAAMTLAARRQAVGDVNRVSFIDALRWLDSQVLGGSPPGEPAMDLIVNRLRVGRWNARVKKRRMKEYDLMTRPRGQYPQPSDEAVVTA
jgi:Transposase DDE domain